MGHRPRSPVEVVVVEIAENYRDRLIAEIAKIDALLETCDGDYVDKSGETHLFAIHPILDLPTVH